MSSAAKGHGRRIRAARLAAGQSQSGLAKAVDISPSYLNLIEHDRRAVGGRLLTNLARALSLPVGELTDPGDPRHLAALKSAMDYLALPHPPERPEDFLASSPGWARIVAGLMERCEALEQQKEVSGQDGATEEELYDLISAVTSIRSSASILVEADGIDKEWQRRFAGNIHSESLRLEEQGQGLIERLGPSAREAEDSARRRLEIALQMGPLPEDEPVALALESRGADLSDPATRAWAARIHSDREQVPAPWLDNIGAEIRDPFNLAVRAGLPPDLILRRLAFTDRHARPSGLIIADRSGAFSLSAPPPLFLIPARSPPCALWPVFDALGAPGVPASRKLEFPGGASARFACHAFATRQPSGGADAPVLTEATMLIMGDATDVGDVTRAAPTCAACSNQKCPARREPQRR